MAPRPASTICGVPRPSRSSQDAPRGDPTLGAAPGGAVPRRVVLSRVGPSRADLRHHLLVTGVAGRVSTTREASLRSYRQFAQGDPRVRLGLDPGRRWDVRAVLQLMADRCGVSPDPADRSGHDVIDPDRTLAALDAFAGRLAGAAARRVPVLLGTGHPGPLLGFYTALARALASAGCPVLTPARGCDITVATRYGVRAHVLDHRGGVALVRRVGARGGGPGPPAHTHSPLPVRTALSVVADGGGPLPALVIGDHGWVCGAGQLGIDTLGLADTNDPALFVGEAEGRVTVAVPLDDAAPSASYGLIARYVLNKACLSR